MTVFSEKEAAVFAQKRMSDARWRHSKAVAETACWLAERYGADPQAAYLAGLLHDCAREISPLKLLDFARQRRLGVDAIETAEPLLLHGKVGAALIVETFGPRDADFMNAVALHITGAPGMSLLQSMVFLADFIEPGRSFPEAAKARGLAKEDLNKALVLAFDSIILHVVSCGYLLHPLTMEARNEALLGAALSDRRQTSRSGEV